VAGFARGYVPYGTYSSRGIFKNFKILYSVRVKDGRSIHNWRVRFFVCRMQDFDFTISTSTFYVCVH
jgi:hypothetical protein